MRDEMKIFIRASYWGTTLRITSIQDNHTHVLKIFLHDALVMRVPFLY